MNSGERLGRSEPRGRGIALVLLSAVVASSATGCATNRARTLALMAGAGLAGAALGAAIAPNDENKVAHGALWGGVSAAAAGVMGLFVFDSEADKKAVEKKAQEAEAALKELRQAEEPKLLAEDMVKEQPCRLFRINQWVPADDGTLIHQTEMIVSSGAAVPGCEARLSPQVSPEERALSFERQSAVNKGGEKHESRESVR